ncbi:MAG: deoxyribonuclease IV [Firmicutes bacterium]|jgi:deoxyribonuclease-4|nr:deoxyribonuclease IV [Bacillota bacterium]
MLYLGCHLTSSKGYEHMGKEAVQIGANTFQFFTRNPRGGAAKAIDPADVAKLLQIARENEFSKIIAHAPYTLNPCSKEEKTREFAYMVMRDDLQRMEYLPGNYYNFHPGSHVGQGGEEGIRLIAKMLNDILTPEQSTVVLLETMAGKGSEVGRNFEELAAIREQVLLKDKVGICLDTCHVHDGGYDIVKDLDGMVTEFDRVVGLSHLKALHINDSMNPVGAHKDRHARIGEGYIGAQAIGRVLNHPALKGLPAVLETPQENLAGYQAEIAMLRSLEK